MDTRGAVLQYCKMLFIGTPKYIWTSTLTNIRTVLNDPDTGLIPYLERTLGTSWQRFQIRGYSFESGVENDSGIRIREGLTQWRDDDQVDITTIITLGRVITVTDQIESQIAGALLREQIDKAVIHWARCICPNIQDITTIRGASDIVQDVTQDSGNDDAWTILVIREFELTYLTYLMENFP